jgi:Tol biopolymer transport system component
VEFLILGPLEVSDDGRKLALGGPKQRAILAHLILWTNRVVPPKLQELVDSPSWSPNGKRIAFTVFSSGEESEPYVVDADDGDLIRLSEEFGIAVGWTTDGRRILISANGSLFTVRPDGLGRRLFVEHPPEDGRLVLHWSPDGRWAVMSGPPEDGDQGRNTINLMQGDETQVFVIPSTGSQPSWRPKVG